MRILLNNHLKIKKAGLVILLLSSLLFACKKEVSDKERAGQFVTDLLYSILDENLYSEERSKIQEINNIYGEKINLLLVVKDFSIKDIGLEKCEEGIFKDGATFRQIIDCYIVTVFFTQSRYIDLDGNLKEDGDFLDKGSIMKLEVKKVDNRFRLISDFYLGNMLSEKGEQKFLEYIKKRK